MKRKLDHEKMGKADFGWLKTTYHFSFANYYNPENMNFGVLRVLNDDLIEARRGFNTHPHRDMEIITYVIGGHLTHKDSMGNAESITRGHVQYMSAGTGITHSEENLHDQELRLIQLWLVPDKKGHEPSYGDVHFDFNDRVNKWLHMVSSKNGQAPIKINQDANIYSLYLEKDEQIDFKLEQGRQAYLVQLEGKSTMNDTTINQKDALEIVEETIVIDSLEAAHILMIEMKKTE